jgi:hypothetical protein
VTPNSRCSGRRLRAAAERVIVSPAAYAARSTADATTPLRSPYCVIQRGAATFVTPSLVQASEILGTKTAEFIVASAGINDILAVQ